MTSSLSPRIKELIAKARIVSFDGWQEQFGDAAIARFQTADDDGVHLDDATLESLPAGNVVQLLKEQARTIVDTARAQVLEQFPGITDPGGGLYPSVRADACWRDFWHFLRCISYGIAAQRSDYTSTIGLSYLEQLYQELQVPLDAMVYGLRSLQTASEQQLSQSGLDETIAPYFEHLIHALNQFQPTD